MFEVKEFYDKVGSSAFEEFQEALNNSELPKKELLSWKMGVGADNDTVIVAIWKVDGGRDD